MLNNHNAYKYETPYKDPFVITQCFTNGAVLLKCGATISRYNIHRIKPYKYYTKFDNFSLKNMADNVNILVTIYIILP